MRNVFLLLVLLGLVHARAQDTLHVRAHDRATVVTDRSTGNHPYPVAVRFPAKELPVRRVVLTLTLACPDGMRCGDWDYLDRILIRPMHRTDTFEVARMLTPYGGLFGKEWRFSWQSDVTDFSTLLRDSVEVIYAHGGYEASEDRGWAVTTDFHFVLGPPPAEVLAITELYRVTFVYGDRSRSIEADLPARSISTDARAALLRIRTHQTGHGMNADDGCGEFCSKWRSIKVDKKEVGRRALWKGCGSNPLFPQAGTWLFDRADWCPGALYEAEALTVPIAAGAHVVDIDMEPYAHDSSEATTDIAAYAIQLAKPRAEYDAAIEAILIPNDDPRYGRFNPAVHEPQVVVRNLGSEPMDMVLVEYGTEGFPMRLFVHGKRLRFGESDTVMLPHLIDMKPGLNTFVAKLSKPGSHKDAWKGDNVMRATFTAPDMLDSVLVVQLRTNAQPEQNSFRLANTKGHAYIDHPLGSLKPDSLYTDTLRLPPAGYVMQLADTAGDGLTFWYNAEGGSGYLRLLDGQGRLLKRFESDCGDGLTYQFRVGDAPTLPVDDQPAISVFPSLTAGPTVLDYFANEAAAIRLELRDEQGTVVWSEALADAPKQFRHSLDLSNQPRGRYTLKVLRDEQEVFSGRLRLIE
ncbi:MAG: peptide-N-glycosidase [Flavobacteriales bacterium]|nr:peptide-N-glycosidase [Flavobacteriales bacterium]